MRLKWVYLGLFLLFGCKGLAQPFSLEDSRFSWGELEPFKTLDLSGQEITILGPWKDEEQAQFETVLSYFTKATGAKIRYGASESFETAMARASETGNLPNIAIIPEVSQAKLFAEQGLLTPLSDENKSTVLDAYIVGNDWVNQASFKNPEGQSQFYGFFYGTQLESLVWYSKRAFARQGYTVPESLEELFLLTERIAREGQTPWCIGFAAGDNTGWPASNWVENLVLRQSGAAYYDQWVNHQVAFSDTPINQAIEVFGKIVRQDAFVKGGAIGQLNTRFNESIADLFAEPPACYLDFLGSFIAKELDKKVAENDLGVFYFPNFVTSSEKPGMVSAPLVSLTTDSEAARSLLSFLQTSLAQELLVAQGEFLSPYKDIANELYPTDYLRRQNRILNAFTSIRFDGSEQMPGPVRAAFYGALMDYVSGAEVSDLSPGIEAIWQGLE